MNTTIFSTARWTQYCEIFHSYSNKMTFPKLGKFKDESK